MLETCECCGKYRVTQWFLIDENAEVELCTKCAKELKTQCQVEAIK